MASILTDVIEMKIIITLKSCTQPKLPTSYSRVIFYLAAPRGVMVL